MGSTPAGGAKIINNTMKIQELLKEYDTLKPAGNVEGENLFPAADLVGKRVYHCTNKLEQIRNSGGLRPRKDVRGEKEYGRIFSNFRPAIGVFVSLTPETEWGGNCLSFVVEPTDKIYHAYAEQGNLIITNAIALDRIAVENEKPAKKKTDRTAIAAKKGIEPGKRITITFNDNLVYSGIVVDVDAKGIVHIKIDKSGYEQSFPVGSIQKEKPSAIPKSAISDN